ncbi:serine hydrolase [Sphingomonas sp. IC081]|uniref:serine hydrolase domain-containing protein n=1 Tax=Sphingomonas sp. IC081 TaxID=304378 RepID=UPI00115A53AE|nr:serine hydrolase domain-containing protein [Sphingomonas sp. IC081]QDK33387.1 serine hydrolase [Sphingomonas sp. IC081]
MNRTALARLLTAGALILAPTTLAAAPPPQPVAAVPSTSAALTPVQETAIDAAVTKALAHSGVPSAQVAIARGGQIVFARAWGKAGDNMPARIDQPYQIASNSKQFLGALILKLRDQGKLSLDDTVSKYLAGVSGGEEITIRQLLSHTSGLRDFWPQDYDFVDMRTPVKPEEIVKRWGTAPLDYKPGTRWQYSNTGYVVAGLIAEKAGGAPLWEQFERELFQPLGLHPLKLDDTNKPGFPQGYHRYALGPVVAATPPASGWLWAAGEISMTASDLARWDIARLHRTLLPAADWEEQEAPVILADGTNSSYGLGVFTRTADGRRIINHGGESTGFLSQATMYPDSDVAIVVLTNADFGAVTGTVTSAIADIVMPRDLPLDSGETARTADARAELEALVAGKFEAAHFTAHAQDYFSGAVRKDYRESLAPLGPLTAFEPAGKPKLRGGFVNRTFVATFGKRKLAVSTYADPGAHGAWEQFIVMPSDD